MTDEMVTIVDRSNRVVGACPRSEMRAKRLPHRASFVLVFNSLGEVFVQERTVTKDVYPGCYEPAAGGVVLAAESYEESAGRELEEELGIRHAVLVSHGDFYFEDDLCCVWGRIFSCEHNGAITFQPEEVASGRFMKIEEVLLRCENERFAPDSLEAFRQYLLDRHRQS